MGKLQSPHGRDDLIDRFATARFGSKERLGPILSGLGLVGWLLVGLTVRLIWSRYDQTTDVLLLQGVTSSLASVLVVIGGGAASLTLSVVGGLICGTRIVVKRIVDRWVILGLIASLLGLMPILIPILKLAFRA